MSRDDMEYYIKSHWLTRAYTIQAVARHMSAKGSGKIVVVGTDAGRVATVGESMIGGSSSGMMQMYRTLARELGRNNIRINTVSMSFISDAIPAGERARSRWQTTMMNMATRKGSLRIFVNV